MINFVQIGYLLCQINPNSSKFYEFAKIDKLNLNRMVQRLKILQIVNLQNSLIYQCQMQFLINLIYSYNFCAQLIVLGVLRRILVNECPYFLSYLFLLWFLHHLFLLKFIFLEKDLKVINNHKVCFFQGVFGHTITMKMKNNSFFQELHQKFFY